MTSVPVLVPAAGASSRCPEGKLLKLWRGKPLIQSLLDTLTQHPSVGRVLVVSGRFTEELRPLLAAYPNLECRHHPDWARGLSSTLKFGESLLPRGAGFAVALADTPCVKPETLDRLLADADAADEKIRVPVYQGRQGHPVYFPSWVRRHWHRLEGDSGAKVLLARWPRRVERLEVDDPGILRDFDRAQDFEERPA